MMKNALLIFGLCTVLFLFFLPSYLQMQEMYRKNEVYAKQIESLTAENEDLREERRRLEEDPEYLERVAREKLGIVKEGEEIYRLVPVERSVDNRTDNR